MIFDPPAPKPKNKYGARKTAVDGHVFASAAEAARYVELKRLEAAGEVVGLELQPRYPLDVNGVRVGAYVADFYYRDANSTPVTEDVKGVRTPVYRMKKKLMLALYGIDILETGRAQTIRTSQGAGVRGRGRATTRCASGPRPREKPSRTVAP